MFYSSLFALLLCVNGIAPAQSAPYAALLSPDADGTTISIARSPVILMQDTAPTTSPAPPPRGTRGPVRISGGVMSGQILTRVDPIYPAEAKSKGIQGVVVLSATIGADGTVQQLSLISGPPDLGTAALDAVRQWTYRPYLLNGEPTEVNTTVTVNFHLNGPPS